MFIIENYFNTRKDKILAWEEAREKWVNEKDSEGNRYYHRDRREYVNSHPYPVVDLWFVARMVAVSIAVLCLLTAVGVGIFKQVTKPDPPKKPEVKTAQADGTKCGDKLKINDHVRIQYGDYADKTGRVIGGCANDEEYQVKIDDHQKASIVSDGQEGEVEVGGRTISVKTDSNLVVVP